MCSRKVLVLLSFFGSLMFQTEAHAAPVEIAECPLNLTFELSCVPTQGIGAGGRNYFGYLIQATPIVRRDREELNDRCHCPAVEPRTNIPFTITFEGSQVEVFYRDSDLAKCEADKVNYFGRAFSQYSQTQRSRVSISNGSYLYWPIIPVAPVCLDAAPAPTATPTIVQTIETIDPQMEVISPNPLPSSTPTSTEYPKFSSESFMTMDYEKTLSLQ